MVSIVGPDDEIIFILHLILDGSGLRRGLLAIIVDRGDGRLLAFASGALGLLGHRRLGIVVVTDSGSLSIALTGSSLLSGGLEGGVGTRALLALEFLQVLTSSQIKLKISMVPSRNNIGKRKSRSL